MPTQAPQSTEMTKIIAPGDMIVLSCPEGTLPGFHTGDAIPNATDPNFFVIATSGSDFTLGPAKTGTFELTYQCNDQNYQASIEVPQQDPSRMPPHEGPLGLISYSLSWLWIAILAVAILAAIWAFWWRIKKKRQLLAAKKILSTPTTKKSTQQLLQESILMLESVERSPNNIELRSDELYQKGYRSLRGFLESELKLRTQAETTTQFLGSLKIIASGKQISSELLIKIERSMNFSDQNRFGAALSDSPEARKNYATELRGILQSLQKISSQWSAEVKTGSSKP